MRDELIMKSLKYLFDIAEKSISADLAKYQVDKNAETQKILQRNKFQNQQTLNELEFEYAVLQEDYKQSKSQLESSFEQNEAMGDINLNYINEIGESIFGTEDGAQLVADLGEGTLDALTTSLAETDSQKNRIERYKEAIANNKRSIRVLDKTLKDRQKFAEAGIKVGMQEDINLANALNSFSESDLEEKFRKEYVDVVEMEEGEFTPIWNARFQAYLKGANIGKKERLDILKKSNEWLKQLSEQEEYLRKISGETKFAELKETGESGFNEFIKSYTDLLTGNLKAFSATYPFSAEQKVLRGIDAFNRGAFELKNFTGKNFEDATFRQGIKDKLITIITAQLNAPGLISDNDFKEEIQSLLDSPNDYNMERLLEIFHVPTNDSEIIKSINIDSFSKNNPKAKEAFLKAGIDIPDTIKQKTFIFKNGERFKTKGAMKPLHFFSTENTIPNIQTSYESTADVIDSRVNSADINAINTAMDLYYQVYSLDKLYSALDKVKKVSNDELFNMAQFGDKKVSARDAAILSIGFAHSADLDGVPENSFVHSAIKDIEDILMQFNVIDNNKILNGVINDDESNELQALSAEEIVNLSLSNVENAMNADTTNIDLINSNLDLKNLLLNTE